MSFEYITLAIEKWKLNDFMEIIDRFEDVLADTTHHKIYVGNNYQTLLLHLAGKSILTSREIITLCALGYPDGALSLGRNLYEQMIIVAFFEMHKGDADFHNYVDDFFLSYEVQRNKCLRDVAKYIPDDNIDNLNNEYEELKNRTIHKIKGDYWWSGCNSFTDLISHVMQEQTEEKAKRFLGVHYARYKRACVSLHASCMGNSSRIGHYEGFEVVDTSSSMCGQSSPLVYSAISLISIIGFVCACFQIDSEKYIKPLNELAIYYQKQEYEDTQKTFEEE